jgi:N6-L-threonylcarbamoyladenine synthase
MNKEKPIYVLGIETSCDDTSLCILESTPSETKVLSMESYSSDFILKEWGGVVPEIASREHNEKLIPLLNAVIKKSNIDLKQINLISVTSLPGLLGPLLTGLSLAKSISLYYEIPIYPANHLIAHLEAIHLSQKISYPYLGVLVSGGHSLFALMHGPDNIKILGSTTDDAAGEAFDKGGKLLGLEYPAGKVIDELAKSGHENAYKFPIGLEGSQDANLSYSGLKTSLKNFIDKNAFDGVLGHDVLVNVCASYQKAIVDALVLKAKFAIKLMKEETKLTEFPIVIGGGVACNSKLRSSFNENFKNVYFVEPKYCTDNAGMIANLGARDHKNAISFPECLKLDAKSRFIEKTI